MLRKKGFETTIAASGEEAVRLIKAAPQDVVILDIKMEGMDGHATLSEIKRIAPDTRVIMLTGHGNADSAIISRERAAFDYLTKPCGMDLLAMKINEAYAAKTRGSDRAEKTAGDVMINIADYTTVSVDESVREAVRKLMDSFKSLVSSNRLMETGHRSLLVFEPNQNLVGVLGIMDLIQAVRPAYLSDSRSDMSKSIHFSPLFWGGWAGLFSIQLEALAEKKVGELMSEPPPTIEGNASLLEVADLMFRTQKRRLIVTEGKKVIGISVAVGLLIWLLPTPEGLSPRAHRFLALLTTIVILWTSEAIPIGVTSILVGCGLIIFDVQSSKAAWEPYANRTVVFVFFILMLGVILGQTSIPNRLMAYILKVGGTKVRRLSFTLCMGATFMAAWAHDATITIILLYAMIPLFLKMGLTADKSNSFTKHFMFMIPLSAACGGGATFLGSGRSPASAELLGVITGYHIGFMEYMWYQFVPPLFLGLTTWLAVWIIYPPKVKELPSELAIAKMPPMAKNEKILSWLIGLTMALWFLTDVTKIHVSAVGGLFIVVCMVFNVIDWKRCLAEYPWNPIAISAVDAFMVDQG